MNRAAAIVCGTPGGGFAVTAVFQTHRYLITDEGRKEGRGSIIGLLASAIINTVPVQP